MKLRWLFISVIFVVVTIPSYAFAQASPAQLLKQISGKLKATGNAAAIVDYVHWETAFKGAKEIDLRNINVRTPEELKRYYRELLSNPEKVIREQMTVQLQRVPEEQQAEAQQKLESILVQARGKFAESKRQFKESTFAVGEETINGNEATVKLKSTYQGKEKIDDVSFLRVNGRWYLRSVQNLGGGQS